MLVACFRRGSSLGWASADAGTRGSTIGARPLERDNDPKGRFLGFATTATVAVAAAVTLAAAVAAIVVAEGATGVAAAEGTCE